MGKPMSLVGQKFGRFTVLSREPSDKFGRSCWKCECKCGNTKIVAGAALTSGNTQSCGCLKAELNRIRKIKDPEKRKAQFWNRIKKGNDDECWIFEGTKIGMGYGMVKWYAKNILAHRLVWQLTFGEIPDGLCVLHHCDNPRSRTGHPGHTHGLR